ncbi:FHA domain-containing protein [Methyloglobulus sp.]|uniref:FHA domain-containing protein n=1 Tax=Methyloglobulus sp. TaxID=2518622 RepID=UPI003989A0B2
MPQGSLQQELELDRTVLFRSGLQVILVDATGQKLQEHFFTHGFTAGRSKDNNIVVPSGEVSRHHLEVKPENGEWWAYDLNSANGVYYQDSLIEHKAKLTVPAELAFGDSGILLRIQAADQKADIVKPIATEVKENNISESTAIGTGATTRGSTQRNLSKEAMKARFLAKEEVEDSGDFTRMVRNIIHEDRTIRSKKYNKAIWVLGILLLLSAGLVGYQQVALSKARNLALDMFYDIKTLEVSLSQSEIMIDKSANVLEQTLHVLAKEKRWSEQELIRVEQEKLTAERKRVAEGRARLTSMKAKYQQYVKEATSLRIRFPGASRYEEELIAKVAREFGESELELPDGFVGEVRRYIKYWQESSRMQQAIGRFEKNNYADEVISALEKEGLPLHFMYLPLQESNYDAQAIGPQTRYGVAKGAWQFLATTGKEYGLEPGPLADAREYDGQDARFNFKLATRAGAKYLKYIFSTEAQASGLLVMACYNYGHNRVKSMVKKMPDNPRDKNFWKFIQLYKIPKETYDYVFYIFSAAVIGEDPQHFGFNFKPPLSLSAPQESGPG